MNYLKNTSASSADNQHPSHYTYNFVNEGELSGTFYYEGWAIIQQNGCPTVADFGYNCGNYLKWMSGYDKYFRGMKNRVDTYYQIDVSDEDGLNVLKQWFYDHANGESAGGLANFAASTQNFDYLPSGSAYAGEKVITYQSNEGGHAMTLVGFNDDVKYDFNRDGKFSNYDNSGNLLPLKQWEVGAVKIANTFGTGWANSGYAWFTIQTFKPRPQRSGCMGNER